MPRMPRHTVHDAPPAARDTLATLEKQTGKLLNIHAHMGHAPVVLEAYAGIRRAIDEHGTFDKKTREAVALVVAAANACSYCQSVHTVAGKAAGWSEDDTVAIREGRPVGPRLDALLAVVREAAEAAGTVEEETWSAAVEAGWSETELAEAFAHLAVNLYTNYFNHFAGTDLDVPVAPGIASEPPAQS